MPKEKLTIRVSPTTWYVHNGAEPVRMKFIATFPAYAISDCGRVWSTHKNRFLANRVNNIGALQMKFCDGTQVLTKRLVALAFVKNPDPKKFTDVSHKDGDKANVHYRNLIWSTPCEAQQLKKEYK